MSDERSIRRPSTVERAYELARSGPCASVDEIRAQLKRERFEAVDGHLSGPSLGRDLRRLVREKRAGAGRVGGSGADVES